MVSKTSISRFLPEEFLLSLGAYLQTCAHIEQMSCALITCLNLGSPNTPGWFESYCEKRKLGTSALLKELRKASDNASNYGFSEKLCELCLWMERFKENRHMAAHGAFFASPNGFLRVDFVRDQGSKKSPNFQRERTAITRDMVEEVCADADRIYLVLMGMLEKIEVGLTSKVVHTVLPIVNHPSSTPK